MLDLLVVPLVPSGLAQPGGELFKIRIDASGVIQPVSIDINGPPVAYAGAVTLKVIDDQTLVTIPMAWVPNQDPCSIPMRLPGVFDCVVALSQPLFDALAPGSLSLNYARISVAYRGQDWYSFPAVTVAGLDDCTFVC